MRLLIHDYETASATDLRKSGAWRYSECPTTEVICLAWKLDNDPVIVWKPGDDLRALIDMALAPDVLWAAWNAAFEKAIHRNVMGPVFGLPDVPNNRWHCIQSVAAMKGIPLQLKAASSALRLATQKDMVGNKATLSLSRPNRQGYYVRSPELMAKVYAYAGSDVQGEVEAHGRLKWLGKQEREVWKLDQEINERGVRLDMDYVAAAQQICDDATKPLLAEFRALTGLDKVMSPKFKDWLVERGCPFPKKKDDDGNLVFDTSLAKENVAKLLGVQDEDEEDSLAGDEDDYEEGGGQFPLPFAYRRPLEIRKILGSASIKKLAAMRACVGAGGRARGLLQYHGAGPGRWAGRLLQPQNFPRPTLRVGGEAYDPAQLVEAILTGDYQYVQMLFGEPIEAVASGLRHALIAAPGHLFEVGDFSKIECVIVLAMAGQADAAADVIARGSAVYTDQATKLYKRPITKHDITEYTVGKANVLACGFQLGWRGFQKKFAKGSSDEVCQEAIRSYREDFAPEVPKLWRALERAAVACVWEKRPTEAYGITYQLEDGWLTARLHSGRKLWYYNPLPVRKVMPWDKDDVRPGFEYSAWKMGQWKRINAYGGLLTENVVQATARDLLVAGMFNATSAGHPLVLTVHDEMICEVPEAMADAKLIDQFMCNVPQWAKQLRIPVATETWVGERYRK